MKIMIGVPTGRGVLYHQTVSTIFNIQTMLTQKNIGTQFRSIGQAEVVTARNILASMFLNSDCDVFIGIDDDVAVEVELVKKLLACEYNFLACYLPQRSLSLDAFAENIRNGMTNRQAQLTASPLVGPRTNEEGVFEIDFIGTGFYILRKSVLQQIIKKQLAVQQTCVLPNFQMQLYGFFNNIIEPDGGIISDDLSFCRRVQEAGYSIYAYKGEGISHTGLMPFYS